MNNLRHNVADPPVHRYHHPGVGGRYAARMIELSSGGGGVWMVWHGYDGADRADHVYVQCGDGAAVELTQGGGDHARPAISARRGGDAADTVWVTDQCRLVHVVVREGAAGDGTAGGLDVVEVSNGWLREPALWRGQDVAGDDGDALYCVAIESRDARDRLRVWRYDRERWRDVATYDVDGFASRPSGAGRLVAFDRYVDGRYRITIVSRDGRPHSEIEAPNCNYTQPRLTIDAAGDVWLSALREQVVQRDGVVSRAAWAAAARCDGERWRVDDVAPLHRGLLPVTRHFGYSGLRRNPRLVATDDGRVHLLWEQQLGEEEDWHAVWNGLLLASTYEAGRWSSPVVLRDGGCCFTADHHAIHSAGALPYATKFGADFQMATANLDAAQPAPAHCTAAGKDWSPYIPPRRAAHPTIEFNGVTHHLLFGDLHNHSVFSPDAEGFPDELYHFARDVAGVDFAGITDNDFYPDKALLVTESAHQRRLVQRLQSNTFFPFAGFEWTYHNDDDRFNHRSIIFVGDESRIVRRIEDAGRNEEQFTQSLAGLNVFAHAHHGEYRLLGTSQEANVEVTSGWAINMEHSSAAHDELKRGQRFGFIGGSDSHRAVPGLGGALVGVWVTQRTRQGIVDALRDRRCFATTGDHIAVDFRSVDNSGLRAFVAAQHPLRRVTVFKNGQPVYDFPCTGPTLDVTWADPAPGNAPQNAPGNAPESAPNTNWYYLRVEQDAPYQDHPHNVCQAAGHLAWSSPVWIQT